MSSLSNRDSGLDDLQQGWTMLHRAAAKNYFPRVKKLCTIFPEDLEAKTSDSERLTPLLAAAKFGSVEAFLVLLKEGASPSVASGGGLTPVMLAASQGHIQLILTIRRILPFSPSLILSQIEHFLWKHNPSPSHTTQAMVSLEALLSSIVEDELHDTQAFQDMLSQSNIVEVLEKVFKKVTRLRLEMAAISCCKVLSILSKVAIVNDRICDTKILRYVLLLMETIENPDAHYRAMLAIAELIRDSANGSAIVLSLGGPGIFFSVMEKHHSKELHMVAIKCIANSCTDPAIAKQFTSPKVLRGFLQVLTKHTDTEILASTVTTVLRLAERNTEIQQILVGLGMVEKIISLIKPHDQVITHPVIKLLHSFCKGGFGTAAIIKKYQEVTNILMNITKYSIHMEIQHDAFEVLWKMTGDAVAERRSLAKELGPNCLIALLTLGEAGLQHLAVSALQLLTPAIFHMQQEVIEAGGIASFVKIVQNSNKSQAKIDALLALRNLSCQMNMRPNITAHEEMVKVDGIHLLLKLCQHSNISIREEAMSTLAAFSIRNRDIKDVAIQSLDFPKMLRPFQSTRQTYTVGMARTICYLAYNALDMQSKIVSLGGLMIQPFLSLLTSADPFLQVEIAFQMVVLARVFVHNKSAHTTAFGLKFLVKILRDGKNEQDLRLHAMTFIGNLLHMRAGIVNALVTLNLVPLVVNMLHWQEEEAQRVAAITLCMLTNNPRAGRIILKHFRHCPKLFVRMMKCACDYLPSRDFLESWSMQRKILQLCKPIQTVTLDKQPPEKHTAATSKTSQLLKYTAPTDGDQQKRCNKKAIKPILVMEYSPPVKLPPIMTK